MAIPLASREEYIGRFWAKVAKGDGCWEWTGPVQNKGYGYLYKGRKRLLAHRFAFETERGEGAADGKFVLHSCDNPLCCRPSHLHLGDQAQNMREAKERRRVAAGERNGRAVLRADDVAVVRSLLSEGVYQKDVARRFGVSQSAISLINRNRNWACQ